MAEVRKFNDKKQFWLRNKYPNKNMLSKDEKFQWNYLTNLSIIKYVVYYPLLIIYSFIINLSILFKDIASTFLNAFNDND